MYETVLGSDTTGSPGNQPPPDDFDHFFVSILGPYDFHLEPVGHKAVNNGLDLSGSFADDIDGEMRSGSWDIGADEIPPTPTLLTWQEVEP
ncbi:MAG: hypothetical protein ACYS15_08190 [Planctomycetota bacterium]|jgi:hypothetical protein